MSESLINPDISPNMLRAGSRFYFKAMEQLDVIIHGEEDAKAAFLGAAVARENLLLFGDPGGGKSVMLFEAPRIFGDPGEHDIKRIPPQSDLTGKQLTGGSVTSTKKTHSGGITTEETTTTEIDPILHQDARIIIGDEVNRANPFAVGAMLEALESGRVITSDGITKLGKLMFSILAINPPGTDRTVHPLSSALISRMAIGARMGENTNGIVESAFRKELSRPEEIKQVATYQELEKLQEVAQMQFIPGDVITSFGVPVVESAHNLLRENGSPEGKGRLAQQVTRVSSALATLKGNTHVTNSDIYQATKFAIEARLGALNKSDEVKEVLNTIITDNNVKEVDTLWLPSRSRELQKS